MTNHLECIHERQAQLEDMLMKVTVQNERIEKLTTDIIEKVDKCEKQ